MRLLGAVRLSRDTDDTTSPARQRQAIEAFAVMGGHTVVHVAEDIDVSGAVPPAERPELGPWLTDPARLAQWDACIVHKPDRLSRSLRDFLNLVHDLERDGKSVVSIDPALDFSTDLGRLVANILLSFAEFERRIIAARTKDAYHYIKQDSGYPGGQVPFGYTVRKRDGKGWEYAHDPEFAPVVEEMTERAIGGESMRRISMWLNESAVPTSRDVVRRRAGKPEKGSQWSTEAVRSVFNSPAIAGMHAADGKPLRDADGLIVDRCEGIIDRDTWERLKLAIAGSPHKAHRVDANPLLRVAYCALDGAPFYTTGDPTANHRYRYYRCSLHAKGECRGRNVPAEWLENITGIAFLGQVGDTEIIDRIEIPAEDHTRELAETDEAIDHLDAEYREGRLNARAYSRMISSLEERRDRLAALPSRPATWKLRPTGETFGQRWGRLDPAGRRKLMIDAGFEVRASRTSEGFTFGFQIDPELAERAQQAAAGQSVTVPGHQVAQESWQAIGSGSTITAGSADELMTKLARR
jgi:site-specific DNA recombinase